jgi:minor histocompatibility antigen H13
MIGLGDVVIPGLLASLCIRCDLIQAFKVGKEKAVKDDLKEEVGSYIQKEMGCYYFNAMLIGFVLGLVCTYSAMIVTGHAQPALLYILPSMAIVYLVSSFLRNEFVKMLSYNEDTEIAGAGKLTIQK